MNEFPATVGHTDFESFAALWFLLFGIFLIPLGLLVHSIEKQKLALPPYFTWTYLLVVLIGVYMVPNSGITFFMLPQAIYMLIRNLIRSQAIRVEKLDPVSLNQ